MIDAYLHQPREVSIETLALCNAACTFCPYPTLDRKGARMDDRLLFDLIDQMASWREPFFISPFKVNEPLLDVRLSKLCQYIEKLIPAARIRLFTNGSPLTSSALDWIDRLERVEHLWISLNEVEAEKYRATMSLDFEKTAGRLDMLHACVVGGSFGHPVVVSKVCGDEPGENKAFVDYCQERWPRFQAFLIKRDGWLGYVKPGDPRIPAMPCGRWWELSIMATGKAALCCMDGTGEYAVGDANTTKLLDIYNQNDLLFRRKLRSRAAIDPCERCTY